MYFKSTANKSEGILGKKFYCKGDKGFILYTQTTHEDQQEKHSFIKTERRTRSDNSWIKLYNE